jgi:outer membrane protein assembly factor BamE (lipoprotein component of BamABCDE complex)
MSERMMRLLALLLALGIAGCASEMQPGVTGNYQTWDDVINRWIGKQKSDLYYELGPPNLHPKESKDGYLEMGWDFTIDRMPGQADYYGTLPMYGGNVSCQLIFFSDPNGLIVSGRRIGCD